MKIEMVKGRTLKVKCIVYLDVDTLTVANLAGATMKFMIKKSVTDIDGVALLTKTIGTGILVTDSPNGLATITIDGIDSEAWSYQQLFFEMVTKLSTNELITSGVGIIELKKNIINIY